MKTCLMQENKKKTKHINMAKHRLKRFLSWSINTCLPCLRMVLNSVTPDWTVLPSEPAGWNSHICDTAKKCWLLSKPDLLSMFHVWSERIQTVHRDIRIPKIHTNGIIGMKYHLPFMLHHSVQFSLVFSAAMSNVPNDTTSKLHTYEPQKCGSTSFDP